MSIFRLHEVALWDYQEFIRSFIWGRDKCVRDFADQELANILDPWEEVADPLDPQGYEQRRRFSTFPGETFRVLRDNELKQYGEYRTRRLVLEAWNRLK